MISEFFASVDLVLNACFPSTGEMEAGGIRNSGHPQSFVKFKMSLSYRRHCFKKEESEEAEEEKPLSQACCRCTVTFATSLL